MRSMTFIGVPIDSVGRSGRTEHGPSVLRELGLADVLGGDRGDLEVRIRGEDRDAATGIVGVEDVLATTSILRHEVAAAISADERPLLAGGCCAEVPGALAGARDALGNVGLAYIDGHLDLYDGVTSPTGEAADMPVAVALGFGPGRWVREAGGPSVSAGNTAILGFRDQDESRGYGMRQPQELPGLTYLDVEAIRAEGAAAVGARVAASLSQGRFWLHLDVDVLDQDVFPATDYLMPGGMTWAELLAMMTPLASSPSLAGASIGCYNPEKDPGLGCGRALVDGIGAALSG